MRSAPKVALRADPELAGLTLFQYRLTFRPEAEAEAVEVVVSPVCANVWLRVMPHSLPPAKPLAEETNVFSMSCLLEFLF